jgi:hypothetical protein
MSAILDPRTADKLAKLCGLFSSNHAGERASAAAKADELIRTCGLNWQQVISPTPPAMPAHSTGDEELLAEALDNIERAGLWEETFIFSVSRQHNPLSAKQRRKLAEIVQRLRERRTAA